MKRVRNLRTISDGEFLDEMTGALLAAIARGDGAQAYHWAVNAGSFALHTVLTSDTKE